MSATWFQLSTHCSLLSNPSEEKQQFEPWEMCLPESVYLSRTSAAVCDSPCTFHHLIFCFYCRAAKEEFPWDRWWMTSFLFISIVEAVLCARSLNQHVLAHVSQSLGVSWLLGQVPQTVNLQHHSRMRVHTFSAWLGPTGAEPQKPRQCFGMESSKSRHMTSSRMYSLSGTDWSR